MRRIVLLCTLFGCASTGTTSEETPAKQAAIYSGERGTIFAERPRASTVTIAAPPAAVWLAAKKVFADFEVPLAVENTSTHQMGNPNFHKSRQFAGEAMAQLVDCGSGMTGPKAASYRIYMSLLASIATDGKGSTIVQTTFVPMGQDISGGSADRIPCGTSGRLEAIFVDRIRQTLGK
jgi:hypothetical protein